MERKKRVVPREVCTECPERDNHYREVMQNVQKSAEAIVPWFFQGKGRTIVSLKYRPEGGQCVERRIPRKRGLPAKRYIQKWYFSLKFSPVVETVVKDIKRNPKRMQREAKKQMLEIGIGTKSQQALKLQQEQNKQERKEKSRKRKEAEEQRMFELKQQKKKEKHRGH